MREPDRAEPHQAQTARAHEAKPSVRTSPKARSEAEALNWRLHILQTISDTALAHLELDELLNALLEDIREAFSADNTAILLLSQDRQTLQVRAARGPEAEVMAGVNVPFEPDLMECLATRRTPLIIDDLSSMEVSTPFLHEAFASLVAVPLLVNDSVLGLLHVDSLQPRRFTQEDGQLLRLIGERIALAIDHARLYQETQAAQAQAQARASLLERVQRELREQAEQLQAIFEHAAIGMAQITLAGQFLAVNQRLCDTLGYTREELMSRNFHEISYAPDLAADMTQIARLLSGEIQSCNLEERYVRKDGTLIWVNMTGSLVRDAAGEPDYLIASVKDISARKQAEEEVRRLNATLERRVSERTRQLAEMNQEMEAFAYSVSHDLRAPLRAMQGFAQALQEDFADELNPLAQQYCRRIVAAAARMDTLILDLLAYSHISRAHLQLQPLSLAVALQEALSMLEVEIRESQAQVVIKTPLPWVRAHPATLGQVVSNLLSNAIKFVEPGVRPQVEVWAELREEGAKKRRWVRLWVVDNGIGIDPVHQERIFRVFERLHGIEAYPGTGIGLAIVKKGIERMGGRVGVESRLEAGSRFWVELPYTEQLSEG